MMTTSASGPSLRRLDYSGEEAEPGCDMDYGPGPDGDSDDEDWAGGDFCEDNNCIIKSELHWRKIEKDDRFMRREASWRRMLPMHPMPPEILNYHREDGSHGEGRMTSSLYPNGKGVPRTLGEIYDDVLRYETEKRCLRTRTLLRTSERYIIALQMNVEIKPVNSDEDVKEHVNSIF